MKLGSIDTNEKVLIVAEIGNNHEGSYALAEEMVGRAAESGADAVKFQTFRTELFVRKADEARFNKLKSFELSFSDFERLKRVADRQGILFMSTPLDLESACFLDGLVSAFKIASGDNTFFPLLERLAATGKPLIMSGGIADLETLRRSQDFIRSIWSEKGIAASLAILHCVTSYPVEPRYANLGAIGAMRQALDCTVGYSDHTLGITAPVLAVPAGARIVEKHFTLDKNRSDFRDHQLSADPAELRTMVEQIRQAEVLLGPGEKKCQPPEAELETAVRRSIMARHDLNPGTVIAVEDLVWLRPGGGLAPGEEQQVIGRRPAARIKAGDFVLPQLLETN